MCMLYAVFCIELARTRILQWKAQLRRRYKADAGATVAAAVANKQIEWSRTLQLRQQHLLLP